LKANRLLSILLLLQARGRLTGRELSQLLEVSERTVHRDMEALSASGVPLFALRGSQGGWQLEETWRTEVPGLNERELRALLMAQPRALSDPGMAAAAERALAKLMAALPDRLRQQAAAMRERLHIDTTGWHISGEDLSMLPAVQDAVAHDNQLTFNYTRADGERGPRKVSPLGIVAKGATWYLVARAPNGLRSYRISRMQTVCPLATTFKRPKNFNLAIFWNASTAELHERRRSYNAKLSLDPQAAQSLRTWSPASPESGKDAVDPKGWITLDVKFDSENHARFVVLGFGPKARVLEPLSLHKQVLADARAIVQLSIRDKRLAGRHSNRAQESK
jgi:predicted DNA-binding transcriptional regulator YafY